MRMISDDTPNGPAGDPRGPNGTRIASPYVSAIRHPLALVAAAAVASYLLGVVMLRVLVDADDIRGWVTPRAAAVLNRPVTLGDARLSLLPRPAVRLSDVRVDNPPDFDGPVLAYVGEVRLQLLWVPLLIGRVHVNRVVLDGARIHLAVDEQGTSNFGDLIPEPSDPKGDLPRAPVTLAVETIAVTNASLTFFDAQNERSFAIAGVRAAATLSLDAEGGWQSSVAVRSDSLQARAAAVSDEILRMAGPSAMLTATGDGTRDAIEIQDGLVELAGETLAVRGRIDGLASSHPSFDLELMNEALSAQVLTVALPPDVRSRLLPRVEGTLGVALRIFAAPGPGDRAELRGVVRLDDVGLRLNGEAVVDHVQGLIGVTPETIQIDSVTGTFAGGPFEVSGIMAREGRAVALVIRAQPDLDAFDHLGFLPDGMTVSGGAVFDLSVAGPLGAPDSIEVVGVASLDGFQARHSRFGVPLYVPGGDVTLLGRDVSWSDLTVLAGLDQLLTTGRIRNLAAMWSDAAETPNIDMSVAGPRLDLDAIHVPREATQVTYAQMAFAHLGGHRIGERTASGVATHIGLARPRRLPVRGTVELSFDTLRYRRHELGAVRARLQLADSVLSVTEASFDAWGGHANGSLRLGVGDRREEPFTLALALDSAEATEFFAVMTPIGETVSGTLALDLALEGMTDASLLPADRDLTGRARVSIEDGRIGGTGANLALADFLEADDWADLPFDRWVVDLDIRDGMLEIRDAALSGDAAQLVFSGLLGFDGAVDLSVGLSIPPERLRSVSLRRTGIGQSVLDQLRAVGSPLDLGLRLNGPLRGPALEPDASNALTLARRTP